MSARRVPLALALALAGCGPRTRPVREVARELLADPSSWTVVESRPGAEPFVDVLTPSLDWSVDGGDLPALVMPPPCEVRFEIGEDDGPLHLRASAGAGRRLRWQLEGAPEGCAIRFEIDVNGERRYETEIAVADPVARGEWHEAGGRGGIPLEPGDVVTLRTTLSPPDVPVAGTWPLRVGFGRLVLEREVDRPYVRPGPDRPNVVLVVMDTLRADALSCYGAEPPPGTPAIDALAARGLLYERAYAASSWTWPSTASILTGLPPEVHGVRSDAMCTLDVGLDTLAELLSRRNLATGAFACNPLIDPAKNFDQGFESFDYARDFRMSGEVVEEVRTWIGEHADTRFFLYLHLVDTHNPDRARAEDFEAVGASKEPPAGSPDVPQFEYARKLLEEEGLVRDGRIDPDLAVPAEHQRWIREAYRAAVHAADRYVGEVVRALEEQGILDETVVVFTSDHGEELFDHGLLGHGSTLFQELVHVPLVLAGPGIPRGARVVTPVSNVRLYETIARIGGADPGPVAAGVDLASGAPRDEGTFFVSTEKAWWWNAPRTPMYGVLRWPWVLHVVPEGLPWGSDPQADPGRGTEQLYDLASDPGETRNLAAERPELVQELRARWEAHQRESAARARPPAGVPGGAGAGTAELLKRIGYTGDDK